MLSAAYEPLSGRFPEWGKVAILSWDTEFFGFPVAEYQIGDAGRIAQDLPAFQEAFGHWASEHRIELVSCALSAHDTRPRALMPRLGFVFVDFTLKVALECSFDAPANLSPAEVARSSDREDLERIAEEAFKSGRYHADPFFPRTLADRRYRQWLGKAISAPDPNNVVYVVRRAGRVVGFSHVEFENEAGHLHLIAIARGLQSQAIGHELGQMMVSDYHRRRVRRIESSVSASNPQVINFALSRNYRVSNPQIVFHWHAPDAPHLLGWDSIFSRKLP